MTLEDTQKAPVALGQFSAQTPSGGPSWARGVGGSMSSLPSPDPLDARSTPSVTTTDVPRYCPVSPVGRITPSENRWSKVKTLFLETSHKHSFCVLTNAYMLHKLLCVGADRREPSVSTQSHLTDRAAEAQSPLPSSCLATTSRVGCLPHHHSADGMGAPRGQEPLVELPGRGGYEAGGLVFLWASFPIHRHD